MCEVWNKKAGRAGGETGGTGMSMGSHQSARQITDTWLTPPEIIAKLGVFDLDPCCPSVMPWRTANTMISLPKDGLSEQWTGRVWLNPPWGNASLKWIERLAEHGNGIALLPARTETRAFFEFVWNKATAVLFVRGRPCFHYPDGSKAKANCGVPIVLVAYGKFNAEVLSGCDLGAFVGAWAAKGAGK